MPQAGSLGRDLPGCLYVHTAAAGREWPALAGAQRCEVAIVGGGYTGLSAALHLAMAGRSVALLEANEPGWGAAGRNGGQVNPGLKHEPDEVEAHLGPVHGPRLVQLASDAGDRLFELIERHAIDCEATRGGTIRAAPHERLAPALAASVAQWQRRGAPMQLWDAARARAATGTPQYVAATFDPRGGSVNPLALARGLAAAAAAAGARIHAGSRALSLVREGAGWKLACAGGTLLADRVVIATDGYSDRLWPGLATSIVPIYSAIIASEPLPPDWGARVLPGRSVVFEAGNVTVYYRRDAQGRLLFGGRGCQRASTQRADYQHLVDYATSLWPEAAGLAWTHWWNGQFALTPDFYPRLHAPAPGLYIGLGYSGRGVALGVAHGAQLALAAGGTSLAELALPVTPVPRIRFHAFWPLGVHARIAWYKLREKLQA